MNNTDEPNIFVVATSHFKDKGYDDETSTTLAKCVFEEAISSTPELAVKFHNLRADVENKLIAGDAFIAAYEKLSAEAEKALHMSPYDSVIGMYDDTSPKIERVWGVVFQALQAFDKRPWDGVGNPVDIVLARIHELIGDSQAYNQMEMLLNDRRCHYAQR